jgi:lysophospholipid acyltransferase (LPLAT)-like uncharacterized protein
MATPQVFKRILAFEPVQWIASAVGAGYVFIVRWTSRIDRPAPPVPGPFIIAMWHGRLAMLHLLRFGELPLIALISGHRDGQLISKCAWHYNIKTVTGSSSLSSYSPTVPSAVGIVGRGEPDAFERYQ